MADQKSISTEFYNECVIIKDHLVNNYAELFPHVETIKQKYENFSEIGSTKKRTYKPDKPAKAKSDGDATVDSDVPSEPVTDSVAPSVNVGGDSVQVKKFITCPKLFPLYIKNLIDAIIKDYEEIGNKLTFEQYYQFPQICDCIRTYTNNTSESNGLMYFMLKFYDENSNHSIFNNYIKSLTDKIHTTNTIPQKINTILLTSISIFFYKVAYNVTIAKMFDMKSNAKIDDIKLPLINELTHDNSVPKQKIYAVFDKLANDIQEEKKRQEIEAAENKASKEAKKAEKEAAALAAQAAAAQPDTTTDQPTTV